MVLFAFSFLLAFSLEPEKVAKVGKEKKGKKGKKGSKKSTNSSKSKKSKKPNAKLKKMKTKKEDIQVENPKYVLEVQQPIGFAHIDYEVFPNKKHAIDVVCWDKVAKVFYGTQSQTYTTILKGTTVYVPIYISHKVHQLELKEVHALQKYSSYYQISITKKKLGKKANAEKTKVFYIKNDDVDAEIWKEAFNYNPNEDKEQNIQSTFEDSPADCLEYKNPLHEAQLLKIIRTIEKGKEVYCKEFAMPCTLPSPKEDESSDSEAEFKKYVDSIKLKSGKKEKKSKSSKSSKSSKTASKKSKKLKKSKKDTSKPTSFKIQIPGEVFFTDPVFARYKFPDLSYPLMNAFVITSAAEIMSYEQEANLNPIIIHINKLNNIPVDLISTYGFHSLYCKFAEPKTMSFRTAPKPVEGKIHFNESHIILTHLAPENTLQMIQTKGILIDVVGVRDDSAIKAKPSLFGKESGDSTFFKEQTWKFHESSFPVKSEVVLGRILVDLTPLLNPTLQDMREKISCLHPSVRLRPVSAYKHIKFTDNWFVNEINLKPCFRTEMNLPCNSGHYLEANTYLSVEIKMEFPQNSFPIIIESTNNLYERMLIITSERATATSIFNMAILNNKSFCPLSSIGRLNKIGHGKDPTSEEEPFKHLVTGFIIDNGRNFLIFVEAIQNSFCTKLWNEIMNYNSPNFYTYFNTNYIFLRRVYDDFLHYGGVYIITLLNNLENILSNPHVHLTGNVPIPCIEALRKLELISKSRNFNLINHECLLPNVKELLSLDLEYGIPFQKFGTTSDSINFSQKSVIL